MEFKLQRIGAWCGPIGMLLYGVSYAGVARMFPPLPPTWSPEQVTEFFIDHKIWVRVGIAAALVFAASMFPFLATLVQRIRRAEGHWGMLTMVQLFSAMIFALPMMFSLFLVAVAAYRPESRPPEIMQTLNDLFWMSIVAIVGPFILQNITLAIASFVETANPPVFTRWYGYFNLWVALLSLPAGALVIFNDGPLAWNGVFAFYLSVTATFVWIIVTTRLMLRGINAEERALKAEQANLATA
ncbi:hypothetical protein ORI20_30275 [Mycobacterium sp. CVI_P3]|uniref:DUF4386 domain-containing protein n=1 Tax=Mycobacterium pinniadriaticum TaxID=2994102 RepID=A0ABT3SN92_9MYCO|nr:hypothetical protein [Mycobacterium pinniadriaticum]MCX2934558.1 hypothetical protein [Mycobacterium pinniadriaticum]MCX2940981.1 hypothetical protein [Mycobacterium pinniadriaticum]